MAKTIIYLLIQQYAPASNTQEGEEESRFVEIDNTADNEKPSEKTSTDPEFLVNMKLRERYRKNRRDEVRRNQYIKAQERLRKKVGSTKYIIFLKLSWFFISLFNIRIY